MRPRTVEDCKEILKFFDYSRKSQCTHTHSYYKQGSAPESQAACAKVLADMKKITDECIDIKIINELSLKR